MNNRKSQNSILVLATLGVYLGLVLAGATPQVLAQAATAKQFSLKDEVEQKDELDKNPKDCFEGISGNAKQLLNLNVLSEGILEYVSDLQKIVSIGKLSKDETNSLEFIIKSFGNTRETSYERSYQNRWFTLATAERVDGIVGLLCPWNDCDYYTFDLESNADASITKVAFSLDSKNLTIKITTPQKDKTDAGKVAAIYEEAFEIGNCSEVYATPEQQIVYKNTNVSFSDNQIFIVTRLPRAGLDSLFATDAK